MQLWSTLVSDFVNVATTKLTCLRRFHPTDEDHVFVVLSATFLGSEREGVTRAVALSI